MDYKKTNVILKILFICISGTMPRAFPEMNMVPGASPRALLCQAFSLSL